VVNESGGHDMSVKMSAEVVIGGKVYTLSGYEGEEYLQKVAAYINNKISELDEIESYKHIPPSMKSTLVQLNIADDYFKAKSQVEKLERSIENKDKEIYDLKHDLISNQVKTESAEDEVKRLQEENRDLLLNKTRLEAALEDKLLDMPPEAQEKSSEKEIEKASEEDAGKAPGKPAGSRRKK
jgi:cell division protein ZapA